MRLQVLAYALNNWVENKNPSHGHRTLELAVSWQSARRRAGSSRDEPERLRIRQEKAKPAADALYAWLTAQRQKVPPGSATVKAIDYSLGRWQALVPSPAATVRTATTPLQFVKEEYDEEAYRIGTDIQLCGDKSPNKRIPSHALHLG